VDCISAANDGSQSVASPGFGARGAQVEAPRGVRVRRGVPLPTAWDLGRGCAPLPRKIFEFLYQNGEFCCILGSN